MLFVAFSVFFAWNLKLNPIAAVYYVMTTMSTVGYSDTFRRAEVRVCSADVHPNTRHGCRNAYHACWNHGLRGLHRYHYVVITRHWCAERKAFDNS